MKEDTINVLDTPIEDDDLVVRFNRPYSFEGKDYDEIDLSGLESLTANDMIAVSRLSGVKAPGTFDPMPEVSINYLLAVAARAAKQPVEFFNGLPLKEALKVKNMVMGFMFGSD